MWNWLKRLFKRKPKPVNDYGDGEKFTPKWGIIVPHTEKAQGAQNQNGVSEFLYGTALVKVMSFFYALRGAKGVFGAAKALLQAGCNSSLEPHLNAYNTQVGGYEILYLKGDSLSKQYAELILDMFEAEYPDRKRRGLKAVEKGDRGAGNLIAAKKAGMKVALLSELFFIDNPNEWIPPNEMALFLTKALNA